MNLGNILGVKRKHVTSNGSRFYFFYKNTIPLQLKFKTLFFTNKWKSGRGKSGSIVVRTKGYKKYKSINIILSKKFRYLNLIFIASFFLLTYKNKFLSLLYLSSGLILYTQTTSQHELFSIVRFFSVKYSLKFLNSHFVFRNRDSVILYNFFIIRRLPKNKPVSLLSRTPNTSVKYALSNSVKAIIVKMDTRLNTSLIRLPSGVLKMFSIYALGSLGNVGFRDNKDIKINKAGYFKNNGKKSLSRGVAKNPHDHPHGGRTKSIKYPRTPWGKTTKYK